MDFITCDLTILAPLSLISFSGVPYSKIQWFIKAFAISSLVAFLSGTACVSLVNRQIMVKIQNLYCLFLLTGPIKSNSIAIYSFGRDDGNRVNSAFGFLWYFWLYPGNNIFL